MNDGMSVSMESARLSPDRADSSDCYDFVEPSFHSQVGLFLTYRCPIRCQHCMVCAGPHRVEEIDVEEALGWLREIASYGNRRVTSVNFTGGEPFYCWDKLVKLSKTARALGLDYAVATNAFWADSPGKTREMLMELRPSDIAVSADLYHAKHIPIENVSRVFDVCQELQIRCELSVAYELKTLDRTRKLIHQFLEFVPRRAIRITRLFPFGRAEQITDFQGNKIKSNPVPKTPCLFATTPYILPNGYVKPCVGPIITLPPDSTPLDMGSLRERKLHDIFNLSQSNSILQGLRIWGPRFLHRLIERHGPKERLPEGYYTDCPCEACTTLLKDVQICNFLKDANKSRSLKSFINHARQTLLNESSGI